MLSHRGDDNSVPRVSRSSRWPSPRIMTAVSKTTSNKIVSQTKLSHLTTMTTSASITPLTFNLVIRQTCCIFTGHRNRLWLILEYIAKWCVL